MRGITSLVALLLSVSVSAFVAPKSSLAVAPRRTALAPLQMANNAGALKRIKTNERNRVRNAAWRSKVRTWTRKTTEVHASATKYRFFPSRDTRCDAVEAELKRTRFASGTPGTA